MNHQFTRSELSALGFEWVPDMRKMVHVDGDEAGDELIRQIDSGELTVEQALADYAARCTRGQRMESRVLAGPAQFITDRR